MITIKAIENNEKTLVPETIPPNLNFGNHCDGVNFYFFESEQEATEFYKNLNK